MESIGTNQIVKIVHVVKDIETVINNMTAIFGMDKPDIIDARAEDREMSGGRFFTHYKGKDIQAEVRLANIEMGPVLLELVQPVSQDSPWAEYLRDKGEGIFSVVYTVDQFHNLMESLGKEGMPNLLQGEYQGFRYGYWDTLSKLGFTLGLQEFGEG